MTLEEAIKIINENTAIEIIMSIDKAPDYYQFVGYAGGDILTYRVYNSGALTQK
jgi:hypothetical protein